MARTVLLAAIAALAYSTVATYRKVALGETVPAWEDAPAEKQQYVLSTVQYLIDNPDATPDQQHGQYVARKEAEGWIYGEVKDEEAKTDPRLVAHDELTPEERMKSSLLVTVVKRAHDLAHVALTLRDTPGDTPDAPAAA